MAKKDNTRDYNGRNLNEDEVLVQIPYDELYVKENFTNPDSIGELTITGRSTRTMSMAIPKNAEKLAKSQMNYTQNEELGHYREKGTDYVDWEQEGNAGDKAAPQKSPEDICIEAETRDENAINFKKCMKSIIGKAPQTGYAMLVIMADPSCKGELFYAKMRLQRSSASEIREKAMKYIRPVLNHKDVVVEKENRKKHDDFYRREAHRLLDIVADMLW